MRLRRQKKSFFSYFYFSSFSAFSAGSLFSCKKGRNDLCDTKMRRLVSHRNEATIWLSLLTIKLSEEVFLCNRKSSEASSVEPHRLRKPEKGDEIPSRTSLPLFINQNNLFMLAWASPDLTSRNTFEFSIWGVDCWNSYLFVCSAFVLATSRQSESHSKTQSRFACNINVQ